MTYETFLEQLQKDLEDRFATNQPENDRAVTIEIREMIKTQGESYQGISFQNEKSSVAGCLNLEKSYQLYKAGADYEKILEKTEQDIRQFLNRMPPIKLDILRKYPLMKPLLMIELIPQKGNEMILSRIPHQKIEDLAVIYRLDLGDTPSGKRITTVITNALMEQLDVSPEKLHQDAVENAVSLYPATLQTMQDVLNGIIGLESNESVPEESMMMVASNTEAFMGASVILYPGFLEMAAEKYKKYGGKFFILPSSINEMILVPDDGQTTVAQLADIVQSINEMHVKPAERLSDNVYHYSKADGVFELAG